MRRTIVSGCVAGLLSLVGLIAMAGPKAAPADKTKAASNGFGNSEAITENELRIYDYFLASDQLEGRNFPSRGYDTAALYVASHLAEWGLKPMGSSSNTNGPLQPYLMPIELVTRSVVADQTKVSITAPPPAGRGRGGAGGGTNAGAPGGTRGEAQQLRTTDFEYQKDFTVNAGGRGQPPLAPMEVSGKLVFAGNGYVVNKTNTNPYNGIDVNGKIIVVAGVPQEIAAQQAAGGRGGAQNPLGEACKDFMTPEQYGAKNGAVAVIAVASYQQLSAMANPNTGFGGGRGPSPNGPAYQVVKFSQTSSCPGIPAVTAGTELTNAIFQGEKVSGAQAFYSAGNSAKLDSFELGASKTASIKIEAKSEAGHGENVVALLEGSDPVLKNEYVIMSAHLDHIGLSAPLPNGHNVNNGADDDGSGSTGLLGVAHEYAEGAAKGMRPKRSIIFLWNGGEEKGLWGSQYFNMFPPVDLAKVVADLNMDMIGRTKNPNSVDTDPTHRLVDPGSVMIVGPNISSDDLEKTIETVNNGYQKLGLDHFYDATAPDATHDNLGPGPQGQRIFYRSDHYNFAKMGVPIAFFTIGLHVDYHRPTDTPEKIDYHEIQVVSKTVAAVGWTLANQAGRPKLNSKLPEQLVKDMKTVQEQGWGKVTPVLAPLPGEPY